MKLVKENKPQNVRYETHGLALDYGQRVLRIPPYHSQYNALELIWAQNENVMHAYCPPQHYTAIGTDAIYC